MQPTVRSTRLAPSSLLLPLVAILACGPTGDPAEGDAATGDPATGDAPAMSGATPAAEAFVDGPDLWLADLEYDADGVPALGAGRNVTSRAGYDNQPNFLPDGSILYTRGVGDRTDIWRYDPDTDTHAAVTETPDRSEYSPTPTPDGTGFSAIVVEPDSTQRLWRFDLDGSNGAPIFEDVAPVGYHAWIDDDRVGMFVLGDPPTLQVAVAGAAGPAEIVDEDIGRSLNRIPGREAISYPARWRSASRFRMRVAEDSIVTFPLAPSSGWEVRALVPGDARGEAGPASVTLVPVPSEDHAWAPGSRILHGWRHHLVAVGPVAVPTGPDAGETRPAADAVIVGSLPDTAMVISRLAVSDDGASIVLVVDRPRN